MNAEVDAGGRVALVSVSDKTGIVEFSLIGQPCCHDGSARGKGRELIEE